MGNDPAAYEARVRAEAARLAAELLADARHELRTPLAVIRGHAQLLQRHAASIEGLSDADRARLIAGLVTIDATVTAMVEVVDRLEVTRCDPGPA